MTDTKIELTLPDHEGETVHTIFGDKIAFTTIRYDQDCSSPEENDGFGTMWSGSRKHINFKPLSELAEMAEADPDAVKLAWYAHGNELWYVPGEYEGYLPDKQWDGVSFAGLWVPDDSVRESYMGQDGLTRREWMVKQAVSACEEYTAWGNGECYGYEIKVYKLEHDEDGDPLTEEGDYPENRPLEEDSCWGHIGWDWAVQATRDALEHMVKTEENDGQQAYSGA